MMPQRTQTEIRHSSELPEPTKAAPEVPKPNKEAPDPAAASAGSSGRADDDQYRREAERSQAIVRLYMKAKYGRDDLDPNEVMRTYMRDNFGSNVLDSATVARMRTAGDAKMQRLTGGLGLAPTERLVQQLVPERYAKGQANRAAVESELLPFLKQHGLQHTAPDLHAVLHVFSRLSSPQGLSLSVQRIADLPPAGSGTGSSTDQTSLLPVKYDVLLYPMANLRVDGRPIELPIELPRLGFTPKRVFDALEPLQAAILQLVDFDHVPE